MIKRIAAVCALLVCAQAQAQFASKHDLKTSGVTTASGTGSAVLIPADVDRALFWYDVTVAATDVGDTLNVYVQKSVNQGTDWTDVVSFTQVLGNGGAKAFFAEWTAAVATETEEGAVQDAGLAAGNVNQGGSLGDRLRVKWTIVDSGDADQSFTWSLEVLLPK